MTTFSDRLRLTKRIVALATALEYACMEMGTVDKELKQRINQTIRDAKMVQGFFLRHPKASAEHVAYLKEELLHGNLVLLGPLIDSALKYPEDCLQDVVTQFENSIIRIDDELPATANL